MVDVVCGIIFNKGKIFIARRIKGESTKGKWEFPGGKVEPNETFQKALERELLEEFCMYVKVNKLIGENTHSYPELNVRLIAFSCDFISGEFHLIDHDQYKWVYPNDLKNYNLAEADIPLLYLIN